MSMKHRFLSADPESSLETLLTHKPVYDSSSRKRKVITGALQELIDTAFEMMHANEPMVLKSSAW